MDNKPTTTKEADISAGKEGLFGAKPVKNVVSTPAQMSPHKDSLEVDGLASPMCKGK